VKRILNRTVVVVAVLCLGVMAMTTAGSAQDKGKSSTPKSGKSSSSQWEKSSSSEKGWLGVSIQDVTAEVEKKMDLKSRDGALVQDVDEDSPASSAGIKEGDVIVQFGDKTIADAEDLQYAVADAKPESKVPVIVMRKGEKKTIDVTVGKLQSRKRVFAFTPREGNRNFEVFLGGNRFQGMSLRELNGQIAQYFGAPEGNGALVWEVEKGSSADKAGVKAGDVVTMIGKKKIKTLRDVGRALGIYDDGEKADVEVLRKGARQTFSLEVKESEETGHNFWFNGPSFRSHPGAFYFNNGEPFEINVPEIDMEQIRPRLEQLRMQMDQMRGRTREETNQLRERIQREVKSAVRVHVQESI
jgi:C-terminal processing protease CtpA/Prc